MKEVAEMNSTLKLNLTKFNIDLSRREIKTRKRILQFQALDSPAESVTPAKNAFVVVILLSLRN